MFSKLFLPSLAAFAVRKEPFMQYYHRQNEEYHQVGLDCVRETFELLNADDWKVEKLTNHGDFVSTVHREKYGKIYKLTCRIKYPAKPMCTDFFNGVEELTSWNPTVVGSKKVEKINPYTDITYNISAPCAGGIIKSREFINLRCCRLFSNGSMCDEHFELNAYEQQKLNKWCEIKMSTMTSSPEVSLAQNRNILGNYPLTAMQGNRMELLANNHVLINKLGVKNIKNDIISQDAKMSLNRSDCESLLQLEKENPLEVETLCDFIESYEPEESTTQGRVWIIASSSVDSDKVPATTKYIRGQNHISAYIIREIEENPNECIVEWIACVDFKGNIPRYVLDLAFTTKMVDFGIYLRKYVQRLYQKPLATTMSRE